MDQQQVFELVANALGTRPVSAERMMLTHSGNTIFDATLPSGSHVIVRMRGTDKDTLSKTTHNIAALAGLGLPVPHVIAADTSLVRYPFRYIILEKIPGRDLLYELPHMTPDQTARLARQLTDFQRAVATLPRGTGFGWGHVGEGGTESAWFDVLRPDETPREAVADFRGRLYRQQARFHPYFRAVAPVCFMEDLTTKNIILENGELRGLIDFDCVCFGDPLWMIGLAAGCIVNDIGPGGLSYIEDLCRCGNLTGRERRIVAYYAAGRALEFLERCSSETDEARTTRLSAAVDQWLSLLEKE